MAGLRSVNPVFETLPAVPPLSCDRDNPFGLRWLILACVLACLRVAVGSPSTSEDSSNWRREVFWTEVRNAHSAVNSVGLNGLPAKFGDSRKIHALSGVSNERLGDEALATVSKLMSVAFRFGGGEWQEQGSNHWTKGEEGCWQSIDNDDLIHSHAEFQSSGGIYFTWIVTRRPESKLDIRVKFQGARVVGDDEQGWILQFPTGYRQMARPILVDRRGAVLTNIARWSDSALCFTVDPTELPESIEYPIAVDPLISPEFEMHLLFDVNPEGTTGPPTIIGLDDEFHVAFRQGFFGITGPDLDIKLNRFRLDGGRIDHSALPLTSPTGPGFDPSVSTVGNRAVFVWEEIGGGSFDSYSTRIVAYAYPAGSNPEPGERTAVTELAEGERRPQAAGGQEKVLVVWAEPGNTLKLHGALLSPEGKLLEQGFVVVEETAEIVDYQIAGTDDGFWILYRLEAGDESSLRLRSLDANGRPFGAPVDFDAPENAAWSSFSVAESSRNLAIICVAKSVEDEPDTLRVYARVHDGGLKLLGSRVSNADGIDHPTVEIAGDIVFAGWVSHRSEDNVVTDRIEYAWLRLSEQNAEMPAVLASVEGPPVDGLAASEHRGVLFLAWREQWGNTLVRGLMSNYLDDARFGEAFDIGSGSSEQRFVDADYIDNVWTIVWRDEQIHMARIDAAGNRLEGTGRTLTESGTIGSNSRIAAFESGHLIAWKQFSPEIESIDGRVETVVEDEVVVGQDFRITTDRAVGTLGVASGEDTYTLAWSESFPRTLPLANRSHVLMFADIGRGGSIVGKREVLIRDSYIDSVEIAAAPNKSAIVWTSNAGIEVAVVSNEGESVKTATITERGTRPRIVAWNQNFIVVYKLQLDKTQELRMVRLSEGGLPEDTPVTLRSLRTSVSEFSIHLDGDRLRVVWTDRRDSDRVTGFGSIDAHLGVIDLSDPEERFEQGVILRSRRDNYFDPIIAGTAEQSLLLYRNSLPRSRYFGRWLVTESDGWKNGDIGIVDEPDGVALALGQLALVGSGSNLLDPDYSFQWLRRELPLFHEMTVEIRFPLAADSNGGAGLLAGWDDSADSGRLFLGTDMGGNIVLQSRNGDVARSSVLGRNFTDSAWVRFSRHKNVVIAYWSPDGIQWNYATHWPFSSDTLLEVGPAVNSGRGDMSSWAFSNNLFVGEPSVNSFTRGVLPVVELRSHSRLETGTLLVFWRPDAQIVVEKSENLQTWSEFRGIQCDEWGVCEISLPMEGPNRQGYFRVKASR